MSEEDLDIVRRAYDAFNRGGPEGPIAAGLWSPDLVWDFSPAGIPGVGVCRGFDEIRAFFKEDWFTAFPFEEWELELDELLESGDQIPRAGEGPGSGPALGIGNFPSGERPSATMAAMHGLREASGGRVALLERDEELAPNAHFFTFAGWRRAWKRRSVEAKMGQL